MVSSAIQKTDLKAPSDKEQLKLELLSAFDAAEEFIRESAYIQVTIIAVEPHITRQGFFTIFWINI